MDTVHRATTAVAPAPNADTGVRPGSRPIAAADGRASPVDHDPPWCSRDALRTYAVDVMEAFRPPAPPPTAAAVRKPPADHVFDLLTHRRFGYLGQTKAAPYRAGVMPSIQGDVDAGRPVRFFFDIGPGYHASLDPDRSGISFDVGLAELLALRQVALFQAAVQGAYAPGVRFALVVDNVCGLFTNGVPLADSCGYADRLRGLIDEVGIAATVDVLLESEVSPLDAYERAWSETAALPAPREVSDDDYENVARFLGRSCSLAEAAERIERYRRAGIVTEALLARVIDGVRLTQRATSGTLPFRSFPGGAQRMQVGEIVLGHDDGAPPRPVLLTSRNRPAYELTRIAPPAGLPRAVERLGCARPIAAPAPPR